MLRSSGIPHPTPDPELCATLPTPPTPPELCATLPTPPTPPELCATLPAPPELCATLPTSGNSDAQIDNRGEFGAQNASAVAPQQTHRVVIGRGTTRRRRCLGRLAGSLVTISMVTACARTGYTAEPDPTFDATWTVDSFEVGNRAADLRTNVIVVDIDTSAAAVEVATGCRSLFGSFTFDDDGRAGFTLPGGTKPACDADTETWLLALDESFAASMGAVTNWSVDDDRLTLTGPESQIVLARVD